jgi:hypothetical protein
MGACRGHDRHSRLRNAEQVDRSLAAQAEQEENGYGDDDQKDYGKSFVPHGVPPGRGYLLSLIDHTLMTLQETVAMPCL